MTRGDTATWSVGVKSVAGMIASLLCCNGEWGFQLKLTKCRIQEREKKLNDFPEVLLLRSID